MIPLARMLKYGSIAPVQVTIKKILFSGNGALLLMSDGNLYVRGQNAAATFGDGSAANTIYTGDWRLSTTNVKDVWTSGGASLCIKNDNTVLSSGAIRALTGSMHLSTQIWTDRTSYFVNAGCNVANIKDMAYGAFDCFIVMNDGSTYSGGLNVSGQHGDGNLTGRAFALNPNYTNIKKVSMTDSSSSGTFWALSNDGTLYGAGTSSKGELLTTGTSFPTKRTLTTGVIDFCGFQTYCVLCTKSDGIYVWGSQFNAQLGDGVNGTNIDTQFRSTIYKLPGFSTAPDYLYNAVFTTFIRHNGSWYSAGVANKGGTGSTGVNTTFTVVQSNNISSVAGVAIGTGNTYFAGVDARQLYGTGQYSATIDLLPGYTASQTLFVLLNNAGIS